MNWPFSDDMLCVCPHFLLLRKNRSYCLIPFLRQ